jgi:diguanylate cyclase (GGDEF)-like protein
MTKNSDWIKQQVNSRIKAHNHVKLGIVIPLGIAMAFLFLSPAIWNGDLFTRLSILCTATLFLCCGTFALSFRNELFIVIPVASIITTFFVIKRIKPELFIILILIDTSSLLISQKVSSMLADIVTKDIETIEQLKMKATTDPLTELLNRNGFEQKLEEAWVLCKRERKQTGFLMVDIDFFKSYNDTLGHLAGDNILKQVADSIQSCFRRESDIISRIGGEEFMIFLPDINDDSIVKMAKTLSDAIIGLKIRTTTKGSPCDYLSVSIGAVTCIPRPGDSYLEVYKQVDQTLYHAKSNGRNCISFQGKIIQN